MRAHVVVIEIVLLAAWLGAAMVVAAVVAPAAFAVLPTRTLAGALVGRVLPVLFYAGLVLGAAIIALERFNAGMRARSVAGLVILVSCAIAQFGIGPRIDRVRRAIPGAMESLSPDDPRRILFGRLHALSVAWMGVAMLAVLVALVLATRTAAPRG